MEWEYMIIPAAISAIGVVISTLISFLIGHKREKNIEKLKGQVEKDNHILKIRFETEFNMLKKLSESTSFLVTNIAHLIPLESEIYNIDKDSYFENVVVKDYNSFLISLNAAGAFLSRDMYSEFHNLRNLCESVMKIYEKSDRLKNEDYYNRFINHYKEISSKWIGDIMPKIRSYIKNYFNN